MDHTHEMETSYPDFGDGRRDCQRVTIQCDGEVIGIIQQQRRKDGSLAWNPCYGADVLTGEIPGVWEKQFPSPYADVAIAWIEDRHRAAIGIEA